MNEDRIGVEAANRAGRVAGTLMLIQMTGGVLVNFALEAPLFGAPGFLANAASHPRQIGFAAVLGLVTEALTAGIAITAFPIFWQRTRSMALWSVALAVVCLAVAAVENAAVMSMVSVSQVYANAGPSQRAQIEAIRVVVASARNWPHFLGRIADGVTIFIFYAVLCRFTMIPRSLAVFGLIAAGLMIVSVGLPLFGASVVFPLLAPLGVSQLILAAWLIAKGFRVQPRPAMER